MPGGDTFRATLTVTAGPTTTAVGTVPVGVAGQSVPLTAAVTSDAGLVNDGFVSFTVLQGTTAVGFTISAPVSAGQASARFTVPPGTPPGPYTVQAVYTPGPEFVGSSDDSQTLTVALPAPPADNPPSAPAVTPEQPAPAPHGQRRHRKHRPRQHHPRKGVRHRPHRGKPGAKA